jgi:hypothetical protein
VYVDIKDAGGARPKVEVMAAPLSGWLCCLPLLNASRRGGVGALEVRKLLCRLTVI